MGLVINTEVAVSETAYPRFTNQPLRLQRPALSFQGLLGGMEGEPLRAAEVDRDHRKDSSLSRDRNGHEVGGTSVPHRPMVPVSRKGHPEPFKRSRVNSSPEPWHRVEERQPYSWRMEGPKAHLKSLTLAPRRLRDP